MDFLDEHPQAFDSLDILDDLASALATHPQSGAAWLDLAFMEPVLARAAAIVDHALRDRPEPWLDGRLEANQAALRCLSRLADLEDRRRA
jgi:hypothetical protein